MNLAGEENTNKYKPLIWVTASASAEVFADIALCPFEMVKVKIQTSPSGTFPIPFGAALKEMSRTKAETRYPFGSLVPLWSRQVRSYYLYIFSSRIVIFICPADSVHDGQVLLLREDCPAVLHARLHGTERLVRQGNSTRSDFRVWLPCWCCLRHRFSPGRLDCLADGQGCQQGQDCRTDCWGGRSRESRDQGSRHACPHDWYPHWLPMVDLRHLQVFHGLGYDWWQVIDDDFYSAEKRVAISRKVDCCIRRIGKDHSLLILCMLFFTTFLICLAIDFLSFSVTEISFGASLRRPLKKYFVFVCSV